MNVRFAVPLAGVLCAGLAAAEMPKTPPPVIRIFRETLKPGKQAAHERTESAFVRALTKANFPVHYLGMDAVAGPTESWFIEAHDSFAGLEKSDRAAEMQPLKGELEQASALDGEYLAVNRTILAVYRKDLSYRPETAMEWMPKARYVSVGLPRMKPNHEKKLAEAVSVMISADEKAEVEQPVLVYQAIAGMPGGTYLVVKPVPSLAEWDNYPAVMKKVREAMGEEARDKVYDTLGEIVSDSQDLLFQVNPRTSYVSKDFAAVDPAFWNARPMTAARAAKKTAKAETAP